MNATTAKNIIILSIFLGVILGILAPIPFLGTFLLAVILLLSAPAIMIFLIMDGKLDLTNTQDSITQGALAGFVSGCMFSSAYALVMFLAANFFNYSSNYILTTMVANSPLWLLVVFILFVGVVFATTNAFSGFLTYYVINLLRDMYEKRNR